MKEGPRLFLNLEAQVKIRLRSISCTVGRGREAPVGAEGGAVTEEEKNNIKSRTTFQGEVEVSSEEVYPDI